MRDGCIDIFGSKAINLRAIHKSYQGALTILGSPESEITVCTTVCSCALEKEKKNALEPARCKPELQKRPCPTTISGETLAQAKHPEAVGVHLLSTLAEQLPIEDLHHVPSPNPYVSDRIRHYQAES